MSEPTSDGREGRVPVEAAICGLYCTGCSIFIASHEDPARLKVIADRWGVPVEQIHCDGCRSTVRTPYCRECTLFACATERGHDFCGECADYPCERLREFQAERPHRIELWRNLDRIRTAGVETWLEEMREHYRCHSCSTINSTYDAVCRRCGREPANAYVAEHKQAIAEALSRL